MNYSVIIWKDVATRGKRRVPAQEQVMGEITRRIKVGEIACDTFSEAKSLAFTLTEHGKGFDAEPVFILYQPTGGRALLRVEDMETIAQAFEHVND